MVANSMFRFAFVFASINRTGEHATDEAASSCLFLALERGSRPSSQAYGSHLDLQHKLCYLFGPVI